jgi:tRNA 2-thiocytidine biosynthesis protein TtcA
METSKLHKKIRAKIMKAIQTFDMIKEQDKILLWISGGKDSMLLAKMMCELRDRSHLNFEVRWVYIYHKNIVTRCKVDFSYMKNFFEKINLKMDYIEINLPEWSKLEKWIWISCQRCSYARRITMFKLCEKRWYNKIALGHHLDDGITTLFMNMIMNRNWTIMPPINKMKRWDLTIIRPISFVREKDIMNLVKKENIPFSPCTCPIWEKSKRKEIWNLVKIIEMNQPWSIENMYHAAIKKFILDYKDKDRITD